MSTTKKIFINTVSTYGRSVLQVALAIFSSRWILGALGATDFGLFSLVGSLIVFITFLNGVMSISATRHLAFCIGRGDTVEANKWFNTSLSIHLILPAVLILVGWPVGEYCVRHVFTIPPDRVESCVWVLRMSLAVAFVNMSSVPYTALFYARQRMSEVALWGMLLAVYNFVTAYWLTKLSGDLLVVYAVFGVVGNILFFGVQMIRARILFEESRFNYHHWFDRKRFAELLSFASWTLFPTVGYMLREQGVSILINLYFGPKVNAAYGIGSTVSRHSSALSLALQNALAPEITASEGRGDRKRVQYLAFLACKTGGLLVMLFAIPLVVEMRYIIVLWLKNPPEYTLFFCTLMLCMLILDSLTLGHAMAVYASGRIAALSVIEGLAHGLTLILTWSFFASGGSPRYIGFSVLITIAGLMLARVAVARRLLNMPAKCWLQEVFFPCLITGVVSTGIAWSVSFLMDSSFARFAGVFVVSSIAICCLGWLIVLQKGERSFLREKANKYVSALLMFFVRKEG